MLKHARGAFSLVELLLVIGIISLLLTILVPIVSRAKELAKRAVCATNTTGIAKALAMYAASNNAIYPYRAITGDCTVAVGNTGNSLSNSANLRLVYATGLCQKQTFICPSAQHFVDTLDINAVDFASRNNISYGYQVPYNSMTSVTGRGLAAPSMRLHANVAILADMSPNMNADGSWNTGAAWGADTNSPNHKDEGENVVYADTHGQWVTDPRCGYPATGDPNFNDNIYSAAAGVMDVPSSDRDSVIAP